MYLDFYQNVKLVIKIADYERNTVAIVSALKPVFNSYSALNPH